MTIYNEQNDCHPKVSVVIPTYNLAPYIAETIRSVLAQTFHDYEIIVVNDGSSDTAEFEKQIAPFLDKIVYLKQANGGAAAARNTGIRAARGELLAFLDGDDVWLPNFLQSQTAFLAENEVDMVYSDALLFGENVRGNQTYMETAFSRGAVTALSLIDWTCNVITSGTVVRRAKIVEAGFFDDSPFWNRAQDYEMWFRLAKLGAKISYQRKVLLKYRIRSNNLSGTSVQRAERDIHSLQGIKNKFALTDAEKAAWDVQMRLAQCILAVELGKTALRTDDFNSARKYFANARPHYSRAKMFLLLLALTIAPRAVQRLIPKT